MTENIQLTEGFFQDFAEDPTFCETQPILQVLQTRLVPSASICYRLRLSDGTFTYAHCGFDKPLEDRIGEDGLDADGVTPVIKILDYSHVLNGNKQSMIVKDYEILAHDVPKIGTPVSHTGDAETFRGQRVAKRKLEEATSNNDIKPALMGTPAKLVKSEGGAVMPISGLTPYISGRWRIGGVVTSMEQKREIHTKKGPMYVFSFVLTDKDGNAIKITAFAEQAVKYHPLIKENSSYFISGTQYSIKPANKRYNSTGHDYEITLNNDSTVEESEDPTPETPIRFKIRKVALDKLAQHAGQAVDILAVIDKVEEAVSIKTKDQREVYRRNIQLIDQSATSVSLTVWADQAINFTHDEGRVIGIKGAFIREYNGTFSLSLGTGCRMEIDPDSVDTRQLLEWYENERPNAEVKSISTQGAGNATSGENEYRIYAAFHNPHDLPEKGIYFSSTAMISGIRSENAFYMACPTPKCGKKVSEADGGYRCEKCNNVFPNYTNRYMVSMEISDACSSTWISLFDDKAEPFFGKSADQMAELLASDPDGYKAIFTAKQFTIHNFRCRAKSDNYNDVPRVRIQCFDLRPANYSQYSIALDAAIKTLEEAAF